jgi:hypothetical protein
MQFNRAKIKSSVFGLEKFSHKCTNTGCRTHGSPAVKGEQVLALTASLIMKL